MPTADATVPVTPTGSATRPTMVDGPVGDPRYGRPDAGVAPASGSRLRSWYREALLDAQLLGIVLVAAVLIGLVAVLI